MNNEIETKELQSIYLSYIGIIISNQLDGWEAHLDKQIARCKKIGVDDHTIEKVVNRAKSFLPRTMVNITNEALLPCSEPENIDCPCRNWD